MDLEFFFQSVSNFGFPVVVAGYLLMRFEHKIQDLTDSICGSEGLIAQMRQLKNAIRGKGGLLEQIESLTDVIEDLEKSKK